MPNNLNKQKLDPKYGLRKSPHTDDNEDQNPTGIKAGWFMNWCHHCNIPSTPTTAESTEPCPQCGKSVTIPAIPIIGLLVTFGIPTLLGYYGYKEAPEDSKLMGPS